MDAPRRALVLLDRDGTINVERQYLADPAGVELLPNAAAGLVRLRQLGMPLVVVTNQAGVARGYFSQGTLDRIHDRLRALALAAGARLDGIYVCVHHPDAGCACRKPATGLLEQAAADFGADLTRSFVVGDKALDIEAGRRVGARTILVRTGYGEAALATGNVHPDQVVDDLLDAARYIEREVSAASLDEQ